MSNKPILSFTVKESKWRCGSAGDREFALGQGETALRNAEGYKCCLGFACSQAGYKRKLTDIGEPADLDTVIPGLTERVNGSILNTAFSDAAIDINDRQHTLIETKKSELIALGKRHNIKVKFVP